MRFMKRWQSHLLITVLVVTLLVLFSPQPTTAQTGGGQQQGTIPMGPFAQTNDGLVIVSNSPADLRLGVFIQHHASFIVDSETVNADDIDSDIAAEFIV